MKGQTSLDNVHPNVADTCINQLSNKMRRGRQNLLHTHCILGSQCSGRCHCIAAMSRNDLLVCFQTPGFVSFWNESARASADKTYAPPLESEPAITKTLPLLILAGGLTRE